MRLLLFFLVALLGVLVAGVILRLLVKGQPPADQGRKGVRVRKGE